MYLTRIRKAMELLLFNLIYFSQVYMHCCILAVARSYSSHRNFEVRVVCESKEEETVPCIIQNGN